MAYTSEDIVISKAKKVLYTKDLKYMATDDGTGFMYWKEVKHVSEDQMQFTLGYAMGDTSYDYTFLDATHAANRLNEILGKYSKPLLDISAVAAKI